MTDERLNELLDDARRTWPLPPEPDYQAMWEQIDREAFAGVRGTRRTPSWRIFSIGLAAALMMGIGLGRFSSNEAPAQPPFGHDGHGDARIRRVRSCRLNSWDAWWCC
jgi:hypothetical protein